MPYFHISGVQTTKKSPIRTWSTIYGNRIVGAACDRVCLGQVDHVGLRHLLLFTAKLTNYELSLCVLCDYRSINSLAFVIFKTLEHSHLAKIISQQSQRKEGMLWDDLIDRSPELQSLSSSVVVEKGEDMFNIKLNWEYSTIQVFSKKLQVKNLILSIERVQRALPSAQTSSGSWLISNASHLGNYRA
jgi:hypothetical protein